MTKPERSLHLSIASQLRDAIPKMLESLERGSSDSSQTMVWLVGLASTLLAITVADPGKVIAIMGPGYATLCVLLLTTVTSGVLCRLCAMWSVSIFRALILSLGGHLTGYVAGLQLKPPPELSDSWTEADIVANLQEHLEQDYRFLLTYRVPLSGCRDAYRTAFDLWRRHENEGIEYLKTTLSAHFALTQRMRRRVFDAEPGDARIRARIGWVLAYGSGGLFAIAGLSFVGAMFLIARGLLRMTPPS